VVYKPISFVPLRRRRVHRRKPGLFFFLRAHITKLSDLGIF